MMPKTIRTSRGKTLDSRGIDGKLEIVLNDITKTEVGVVSSSELCKMVAALLVEGRTPNDIAGILGINENEVKQAAKQPLTIDYVKTFAGDDVGAASDNLLQAALIDTVFVLFEIRDDKEAKASTRLAACKEIFDRVKGKAVSLEVVKTLKPEGSDSKEALTDAKKLESDIAALQEQLSTLQ